MNDQMFPEEVVVKVLGETFTLTAFKAKHLRPYIRISRSMNEKAAALGREIAEKQQRDREAGLPVVELTGDNIPTDVLHERCYEEYVELVSVATGKPVEWVEDLGIDDLIVLAGIVTNLNSQRYASKKEAAHVTVTSAR